MAHPIPFATWIGCGVHPRYVTVYKDVIVAVPSEMRPQLVAFLREKQVEDQFPSAPSGGWRRYLNVKARLIGG